MNLFVARMLLRSRTDGKKQNEDNFAHSESEYSNHPPRLNRSAQPPQRIPYPVPATTAGALPFRSFIAIGWGIAPRATAFLSCLQVAIVSCQPLKSPNQLIHNNIHLA